ncbi:head decoration protein [Sinorhizobium meliloti]|uniref:head decoration protein n=1 Tax=Rhizobium meliloti TaxID=382 RepID=UPI000FE0ED29|nr:head decoration protein [Sinorhizobium meliloti]RVG70902.1 hypothetical protein CN222_01830 [Sinorhizobium meliloti]
MATVLIQGAADEGFLLGDLLGVSRETVSLKAGSVYEPGTVVISNGATYETATQALVDGAVDGVTKYGIVCRNTNATSGVRKAAIIARIAAVKSSELILGEGLTVAEVSALLAKEHVIVRDAK